MASDEDFLLQLDELYSQPKFGTDSASEIEDDVPTPDVPNEPAGGITGGTGTVCETFQTVKEAIEMHRLRMQYSLEVNQKVRELIKDMKQDIFNDQKRMMEMFGAGVISIKGIDVDIG
jgi:hypothetical protein